MTHTIIRVANQNTETTGVYLVTLLRETGQVQTGYKKKKTLTAARRHK